MSDRYCKYIYVCVRQSVRGKIGQTNLILTLLRDKLWYALKPTTAAMIIANKMKILLSNFLLKIREMYSLCFIVLNVLRGMTIVLNILPGDEATTRFQGGTGCCTQMSNDVHWTIEIERHFQLKRWPEILKLKLKIKIFCITRLIEVNHQYYTVVTARGRGVWKVVIVTKLNQWVQYANVSRWRRPCVVKML